MDNPEILGQQIMLTLVGYLGVIAAVIFTVILLTKKGKRSLEVIHAQVNDPTVEGFALKTVDIDASRINQLKLEYAVAIEVILHSIIGGHFVGAAIFIAWLFEAGPLMITASAGLGLIIWSLIYLWLGTINTAEQRYRLITRLGVYLRVAREGKDVIFPLIDRAFPERSYEVRPIQLFVNEDNPKKHRTLDLRDGSPTVDAKTHVFVDKRIPHAEALYEFQYEDPDHRIEEVVGHRLRPEFTPLNFDEANDETGARIDKVLKNHGGTFMSCIAEIGNSMRDTNPITVEDWEEDELMRVAKSKRYEGRTNADKAALESEKHIKAVVNIKKIAKENGMRISSEKAMELYQTMTVAEQLEDADLTIITSEIKEAIALLLKGGFVKKGKGPRGKGKQRSSGQPQPNP